MMRLTSGAHRLSATVVLGVRSVSVSNPAHLMCLFGDRIEAAGRHSLVAVRKLASRCLTTLRRLGFRATFRGRRQPRQHPPRRLGGCKLNRSGAVATLKGGSGVYRVSS